MQADTVKRNLVHSIKVDSRLTGTDQKTSKHFILTIHDPPSNRNFRDNHPALKKDASYSFLNN